MLTDKMIAYLRNREYVVIPPSTKVRVMKPQFNEGAIVAALKGDYRRYVYVGRNEFYYIAYSEGLGSLFIQPSVIHKMIDKKVLVDKYADRKGEYWVLQRDGYDKGA